MVDYSKLLTTAQSLIQANGKLITVTKLATAAADSTKPWRGPVDNLSPPANTQTLYAVETTLKKMLLGASFSKKNIPDNVTDFFLAAPGPSTPNLTEYDQLTLGTVTYNIVEVETLAPGPLILLYYFMVMK